MHSSGSPTSILTSPISPTSSSAATCVTVVPGPSGYVPPAACNAVWNFSPSFPAAVFFCILFGVTLICHVFEAILFHKLKLSWTVIMGCSWEFTSFVLRAFGAQDQQNTMYNFWSSFLVLLGPLWINAFIYMTLGRMIWLYLQPSAVVFGVRAKNMARIFVGCDILALLIQAVGGSIIQPGESENLVMDGIHIYMGGVGMQLLSMFIFLAFVIQFHTQVAQNERAGLMTISGPGRQWKRVSIALYLALFLISMRCIYRLVEFALGVTPGGNNPIPFNEWYFYVFDATIIFFAAVVLNLVHPGIQALRGPEGELPKGMTRKEKRAARRRKKQERRAEKQAKREGKIALKRVASNEPLV